MVEPCETRNDGEAYHMVRYHAHNNHHNSTLLDLRVFYVRISNFKVDESTPEVLTVTHIPPDPDSLLEINGVRTSIVSSQLRSDRVEKKAEAATFISTDNIRLSGRVKFEVHDKDELVLSGTLEMSTKHSVKRWGMNCEAEITVGCGFLKEKHIGCSELSSLLPSVEVYATGFFSGTPIILTKTLQLGFEVTENGRYKQDYEGEYDDDMYMRREYADGEMSWFNAGVRVGVGIGLGVCVGLGIGVGLLVRTYQSTSRNFRRMVI